jgi:DNA-binding CsgD family transcriptional regulator
MLVAKLKHDSPDGVRFSKRLDIHSISIDYSDSLEISRELSIANFMKETLFLARSTHHTNNFFQNWFLRVPRTWGINSVIVRNISKDNYLTILESFSIKDLDSVQSHKINNESGAPAVAAIRNGAICFFQNRKSILTFSAESKIFAEKNPKIEGLICLPVLVDMEIWGTIELLFNFPLLIDEVMEEFFTCLALLMGIAIESTNDFELGSSKPERKNESDLILNSLQLPQKLREIAVLISQGKTNIEIAKIMNYSESATRYETVKLYAMLRVKNRAEASSVINNMHLQ